MIADHLCSMFCASLLGIRLASQSGVASRWSPNQDKQGRRACEEPTNILGCESKSVLTRNTVRSEQVEVAIARYCRLRILFSAITPLTGRLQAHWYAWVCACLYPNIGIVAVTKKLLIRLWRLLAFFSHLALLYSRHIYKTFIWQCHEARAQDSL